MRKLKRIVDLLPLFILWVMLSVLLWGFVFTRITDTDHAHKLVFCVDAPVPGDAEIALELKKETREGIRLVRVLAFSYAMMDSKTLEEADLYLIPEDHAEIYRDWLQALPDRLQAAGPLKVVDGVPVGVRVRDGETGKGVYPQWVQYPDRQDYYLCLGAKSLHVTGLEGAVDGEAEEAFLRILRSMEE